MVGRMSATAPPDGLTRRIATVFLPFAGGYYLSYLFRSVNAVIAPQLVAELGLSAGDLGLLTAAYFFSFAAIQLPLGLLLDRFGPRRVQTCLLMIAATGAGVFAIADGLALAILGRALIGLGVAGGLMASFKAITQWFAAERWPLVNGCFLAMGGLGAISATTPVEALLQVTDWRGIFAGLAVISFAASLAILTIVPDARHAVRAAESLGEQVRVIAMVFRHKQFWRITPVVVASTATGLAIQGLWAGPWLRDVAGFDRAQIANVLLAMNVALTAGFVCTGVVADKLRRHGIGLPIILGVGVALSSLVQIAIIFEIGGFGATSWILFGLVSGVPALSYPYLSAQFPLAHAGRVITAVNVLAFGGAFAAQYAMGLIIDLFPRAADGAFPPAGYRAAFGAFLLAQILALAWLVVASRRSAV